MSGDAAAAENATVDVLNGSGVAGAAQTKADELEEKGYDIGSISNAPTGEYGTYTVYDLSKGKLPQTKAKLEKELSVKVVSGDTLPAGVVTQADFVIIIGKHGVN
jgi:polyisoprenyl-teichoic acid--peptidoglycan teichoic acid transferase